MKELNFYQLAKKKMEFENIGVGNTALDETYPVREDIPAELWGKPIVVSAAPPYGPELIEEKHDPPHYQKGSTYRSGILSPIKNLTTSKEMW